MKFEFSGNVELDWSAALDTWRSKGRMEDLPRDIHTPKYTPDKGKQLGLKFAKEYKENYEPIVRKLSSDSTFEALCAFEVVELICWEYNIGDVPKRLLEIDQPLPSKIISEISGDPEVENFSGKTIGEWFSAVFST